MIGNIKHVVANCFSVTWELNLRETRQHTKATGNWSNALYGARCNKVHQRDDGDAGNLKFEWRRRSVKSIYVYTFEIHNAPGSSTMITNYNVMPLKKHAEISYCVKCVTVENERVFGDVYVTQQTLDPVYQSDDYAFSSEHRRRRRNLIQRTLDGPDFMRLNSKWSARSAAVAKSYWQRRNKSMRDEPSVIPFNYENADNRDTVAKRPKVNVRTILFEINRSSWERDLQVYDIDGFNMKISTCSCLRMLT